MSVESPISKSRNGTLEDLPVQRSSMRADILDEAKGYVTKDRQATHGELEDSFGHTAKLWSVHLGTEVTPEDVTILMALLKIARLKTSIDHKDNWVDLAGYAACGGELALRNKRGTFS